MADKTKIEWTDATWNPLRGCTRVSPGCGGPGNAGGCYAEAMAARFSDPGQWGHGLAERTPNGPRWTGKVILDEKALLKPLHWKRPRKIFVTSISDPFHPNVTDEMLDRIFAIMALCPQHTFQLLTKRPERMREYISKLETEPTHDTVRRIAAAWPGNAAIPPIIEFPLPNLWLGVSVENQEAADERIPHLLATPAAIRFLSCEPLLGEVNLETAWHGENALGGECWGQCSWCSKGYPPLHNCQNGRQTGAEFDKGRSGIDWVIAGGESGPNARPMHPDWARSLRDQCAAAGVAFFFKQWGEWGMPTDALGALDWPYHRDHDRTHWFDRRECVRHVENGWSDKYHGGGGALDPKIDLFQTPEYLDQVSRCPQAMCQASKRCFGNQARAAVTRVGKRAASRLLDGVEHNEFPEVTP